MYIFFYPFKRILLRKLCLFISQRCVQSLSDVLESIPFNLCLPSSGTLPSSVREGLLDSEEQCFWLLFLILFSLFCSRGLLDSEEQCFWLLFWIGAVFGPLYFLERVTKHLFLLEDFLPFLRVPQEMVVKQTLVLLPLHVSHMPR